MSLGCPQPEDTWHSGGVRLIRISPLEGYGATENSELNFYKIFGGTCLAAADYELAYLSDWLRNPVDFRLGATGYHVGVHRQIAQDFESLVGAFDVPGVEKPSRERGFFGAQAIAGQRIQTLGNYAKLRKLKDDVPSLRQRVQNYQQILGNLDSGRTLTPEEESVRKEFLDFSNFFLGLEASYGALRRHQHHELMDALE